MDNNSLRSKYSQRQYRLISFKDANENHLQILRQKYYNYYNNTNIANDNDLITAISANGLYFENGFINCFCCNNNDFNHQSYCVFQKQQQEEEKVVKNCQCSLRYEKERKKTFIDWPIPDIISTNDLAKDGFYYLRIKDSVACIFCRIIVGKWNYGDDVQNEHRKLNPNCAFINNLPVGNVTIEQSKILEKLTYIDEQYPTICTHEKNIYNNYIYKDINDREVTFEGNWPIRIGKIPYEMADAGFFYHGPGDLVMCFTCGIKLRNWKFDDDPWIEHVKYNPNCHYVKLFKDDEFIEKYSLNIKKPNSGNFHDITDSDLDFLFNSLDITNYVQNEKEYSIPILRYVLKKKLKKNGLPYFNKESFLNDVKEFINDNVIISLKINNDDKHQFIGENFDNNDFHHDYNDKCKQCQINNISVCFLPCKHFRLCSYCASSLKDDNCPFCFIKIEKSFRVKYENTCKSCFGNYESKICFLPCKHLQVCTMCAFFYDYENIFPIKCLICKKDSYYNFEVIL